MAIYNENEDPNQLVKTEEQIIREDIISEINEIINKYGSFTIADVEAESSPYIDGKGKLSNLAEEFRDGDCTIFVYDPTSHSSDEIDRYDEFYEEFSTSQLKYIKELCDKWAEICEE